ncbi:hypothetical protein QJQ45_026063, partial [Haematococcus lacustris]
MGPPRIGRVPAEKIATQLEVSIEAGVTQAVSAVSVGRAVRPASASQAGQVEADRGPAPIQPQLQHLAAASSAGTSLEAYLHHITILGTWDTVWEVYLDLNWARQWLSPGMGAGGSFMRRSCSSMGIYISSTVSMLRVWAHARDAVSQLLERQKDQSPPWAVTLSQLLQDNSLLLRLTSLAASFAASLAASLAASIAASLAASFLATILRNESQALMHQRKAGTTCCEQRRGQTDYAQPSPAQPSPAQPSPAQPSPAQPSPAQPSPAQPSPAQPSPAQPSPAQPSPAQPSPAQPSPAQPSPAQPSPAQPSPAQPRKEQLNVAQARLLSRQCCANVLTTQRAYVANPSPALPSLIQPLGFGIDPETNPCKSQSPCPYHAVGDWQEHKWQFDLM